MVSFIYHLLCICNDGSIIAFDISEHPDFNQTKRMIDSAFKQYDNLEGLIFHSDQGWQY